MIPLKFKLDRSGNHYTSPEWLSNGHWMLKRAWVATRPELAKVLKPLVEARHGRHYGAIDHDNAYNPEAPDFRNVIPSRDGYQEATLTNEARIGYGGNPLKPVSGGLVGVFLASGSYRVCIGGAYMPLLFSATRILISDRLKPILLIDADDEICGVIMPVRA